RRRRGRRHRLGHGPAVRAQATRLPPAPSRPARRHLPGSVVAAQLTSATPLEELHHRQVHGTVPELAGGLGAMGMLRLSRAFLVRRDVDAARRSIGTFALTKGAERAQARREVIRARLGGAQWNPERDLRITAINIETGEREVFQA